jgi:hypothetical protein
MAEAVTTSTRKCCGSTWPGPHQPKCTRKGGRRTTTGPAPNRSAGRHGQIWDDCAKQAEHDGEPMSQFVGEAITRELARRRRLHNPDCPTCYPTPDATADGPR